MLERAIAQRAPWMRAASVSEGERALGSLPLRFEANRGQADPSAAFVARAGGTLVFVRPDDLAIAVRDAAPEAARLVHLRWVGGNATPALSGERQVAARSNYFAGRDAASWVRDVPAFERVRVAGVYPGRRSGPLRPRRRARVRLRGRARCGRRRRSASRWMARMHVAVEEAALALRVGDATLRLQRPVVYQQIDGTRRPVAGDYALADDGSVRFALADYDAAHALVIDPVIAYSSYLGGAGRDLIHDVAVDAKGYLYVAGRTDSTDFPLANPLFSSKGAGYTAFVAKINPERNGTGLRRRSWAARARSTASTRWASRSTRPATSWWRAKPTIPNFPLANAWQATLGGGFDAYVTKLNAAGNGLVFSTLSGRQRARTTGAASRSMPKAWSR